MFWAQIVCAVLVLDVASHVAAYDDFEELEDLDDDDVDYYTDYDNGQAAANNEIGESERDRARLQEKMITRALSLSEIKEVRGAIKELFSRMAAENPFTPYTTSRDQIFTESTYYATSGTELSYLNQTRFTKYLSELNKQKLRTRKKVNKYKKSVNAISKKKERRSKYDLDFGEEDDDDDEEEHSYRRQLDTTEMGTSETTKQETKPAETPPPKTAAPTTIPTTVRETTTPAPTTVKTTVVETTTATSQPTTVSTLPTETTTKPPTVTEFTIEKTGSFGDTFMLGDDGTTTAVDVTTRAVKRNRTAQLDIPRLLEIIAGIAGEFETNLTRKLNETLLNMSIPTCTTPTTVPPITSEYDANYTGATIAKCFVCGLRVTGVPIHAHCADAFAGDFLPLVPVDPTAKAKISTYRKYSRRQRLHNESDGDASPSLARHLLVRAVPRLRLYGELV